MKDALSSNLHGCRGSSSHLTFNSVLLVGLSLELHSTCGSMNEALPRSCKHFPKLLPLPRRGCETHHGLHSRRRVPDHQQSRTSAGTNTLKNRARRRCRDLSGITTYVSVLTVSSFRPTTGLSIPRSRRLLRGKAGTSTIPTSHA